VSREMKPADAGIVLASVFVTVVEINSVRKHRGGQ
jgi:hypothetical protein